jgi:hypothetical protein
MKKRSHGAGMSRRDVRKDQRRETQAACAKSGGEGSSAHCAM